MSFLVILKDVGPRVVIHVLSLSIIVTPFLAAPLGIISSFLRMGLRLVVKVVMLFTLLLVPHALNNMWEKRNSPYIKE